MAPAPFQAILKQCERMTLMHLWLRSRPTAAERKQFIMTMRDSGVLSDDETGLLIECYELEAA